MGLWSKFCLPWMKMIVIIIIINKSFRKMFEENREAWLVNCRLDLLDIWNFRFNYFFLFLNSLFPNWMSDGNFLFHKQGIVFGGFIKLISRWLLPCFLVFLDSFLRSDDCFFLRVFLLQTMTWMATKTKGAHQIYICYLDMMNLFIIEIRCWYI